MMKKQSVLIFEVHSLTAYLVQFTCSSQDLRSCIRSELNISLSRVNACHAVLLNLSLDSQHNPCGGNSLICSFPEVLSFIYVLRNACSRFKTPPDV